MRDFEPKAESAFFDLFEPFYDTESSVSVQHDPATYTLARMTPLAELTGYPERRLKIIHVAGTKGKGSTCHFITQLLLSAGHTVGLFTSPHLSTVRERFEINGRLATYDELTGVATPLLATLLERGLKPSMFEIFTVMALKLFADAGLEYAVMETGIGGLLDATNYVSAPVCTAITPVSFDHIALLGNTIEKIASQKAGIIKPGVPVVVARQPYSEALEVISARASAVGSAVVASDASLISAYPEVAELVPFLQINLATALTVLKTLGITPDFTRFVMPELRARCEVIRQEPLVVLDGAHNADSIRQLVIAIKTRFPNTAFTVVLGSVMGKDIDGIVRELLPLNADVILTNPETPKASALPLLKEKAAEAGLRVVGVIESLREASQLPAQRPLLFTGSFFTAAIGERIFNP